MVGCAVRCDDALRAGLGGAQEAATGTAYEMRQTDDGVLCKTAVYCAWEWGQQQGGSIGT